MGLVLQLILAALFMSALGLMLFDRPTPPPDARTQVGYDYREMITVGMAKPSDFRNVEMSPTLDFQEFELGGWSAKFTATLDEEKGRQAGPGTIVITIPRRVTNIYPVYYDVTTLENNQVAKGDAPFRVEKRGDDRIILLDYRPKKFDKRNRATSILENSIGVSLIMPSLQDRRLGWGREQIRISYSPQPKDAVALRTPLTVEFGYDGDRYNVETVPHSNDTEYGRQSWVVSPSPVLQTFAIVIEDRQWRWWADRAPDVIFLVAGVFLGELIQRSKPRQLGK